MNAKQQAGNFATLLVLALIVVLVLTVIWLSLDKQSEYWILYEAEQLRKTWIGNSPR